MSFIGISNVIGNGFKSGGSGTPPPAGDTTADGKQAYLIIGDSNAGDTTAATTLGPTTPAGTCYRWLSNALVELTTQDLSNSGSIYGTAYKQFALNRYTNSGLKSVFVNRASGGSEFIVNGDTNNWSTSGALYAPAVADGNACLSNLGLARFKGIFLVLGTNDVREGTLTLPDIYTGMQSLLTRLTTDFPSTPIYMVTTGMYNGAVVTMDARKWGMIKNFFDIAASYPNAEIVGSLYNMYQWGYGFGDSLHLTTAGYNKIGEQLERAVASTETVKEVRRMQSMLHNAPTTTQKAAIKSFYNAGWFTYLDGLQTYVGGVRNQLLYDWTGYTCPVDTGPVDIPNNNFIRTDTTPKYLTTNFVPSVMVRNTTVSNFIEGTRTGVNNVPVATAGIPMGNNSGSLIRIFQTTASNTFWAANDTTNTTYATWTKIPDNTNIAVGRNGTSKYLFGEGVQLQTATVAAGAITNSPTRIGGNGSAGNYMDCQFDRWFRIAYVGVNLSTFTTDLNTFVAAMATP